MRTHKVLEIALGVFIGVASAVLFIVGGSMIVYKANH